jgi:Prp8 binding protein
MTVLWRSSGSCENHGILTGHKQAVLDLHWSRDSKVLFSASADMHLASWDVETGERIRRHPGHEEVINCMDVSKRGEEMLVSGSDDGYIGVSSSNHSALGRTVLTRGRSGTPERKTP